MFKLEEILENSDGTKESANLGEFATRDGAYQRVLALLTQNGIRVTTMLKWKPLQKYWVVALPDPMHYFIIKSDEEINIMGE